MGIKVPWVPQDMSHDQRWTTWVWYGIVMKDDDDLLNASVEVDVSAIVLQLVHLKQSKSQKYLQN